MRFVGYSYEYGRREYADMVTSMPEVSDTEYLKSVIDRLESITRAGGKME